MATSDLKYINFERRAYLKRLWDQLQEIRLGQLPLPIILRFPVEKRCLLSWLNAKTEQPFYYFRTRNRQREIAGVGCYNNPQTGQISPSEWQQLLMLHPQSSDLRLFFCKNFSNKETWGEFALNQYVLPEEYCERIADDYFHTLIIDNTKFKDFKSLEQYCEELELQIANTTCKNLTNSLPQLYDRKDVPNFEQWKNNTEQVLQAITQKQVAKVVLARRSDYLFNADYPRADLALSVLKRHIELKQNVYNFVYSPKVGQYFLGGTPERLFSYKNNKIKTEALAGTSSTEHAVENELFSDKNILEHNLVASGLKEKLKRLGAKNTISSAPQVMSLSNMLHLHSRMEADLPGQPTIETILGELHPTAAVCGEPMQAASQLIDELEPFARGLYAGPIGIADSDSIECAVALRSCLIQENRMSLFAGAGIVEGSEAIKEWDELDTKIAVLEKLFEK